MKLITFEMNEVKNQTSDNYTFDFKIDGKINKDMEPITIERKFELIEVEDEADCKFIVEEEKKANFNCKMSIEKYKEIRSFSFKTSEIITDDNKNIFINKLNEVILINEGNEEEKNNKTIIIIVCVAAGVIIITGVIAFVIIIRKNKKKKEEKIITYKSQTNCITHKNNINTNENIKEEEKTKDILTPNKKKIRSISNQNGGF